MQSIALQGVKKFDNAMTIQTNLKGYVSAVDSQLSTGSSKQLRVKRAQQIKVSVDC
jgi:hypothetical protein